jgi:hypothetical protein
MKKLLLLVSTLLSGITFSQSFDATNEPVIGDTRDFYLCDSFTVNLSTITGSGAEWDYSEILGVYGESRNVAVTDATTSPFASNFAGATMAITIQNSITTFFSTDANGRESQGFLYSEPTFGDVIAAWENDGEITHEYPMALNTSGTDVFDGSLSFDFNGLPQSPACNGVVYYSIDGQGTLLLPGANTYTNVIRYKLIDTAYTNVFLVGDLEVIRTQFEYYDITNDRLPLFIHSTIKIQALGATDPLTEQSIVLSKDMPDFFLGVNENEVISFGLYPNPSTGLVKIEGEFTGSTSVSVADLNGRIVYTANNVNTGLEMNLTELEAGIYTVIVSENGNSSQKRLVIR